MTTALTLWFAGMPLALAYLLWDAMQDPEQLSGFDTWAGIAATAVFVLLWPLFLLAYCFFAITGGEP